ncbi:alanine--tRNA ligase [Mycoplasmoides pneumoniae]|uniref:Alanine--tRNA ligase n=2 Tax=Mycoplasmoides pneumoniae TaxID=2104 RepID=A0AB38W714_MYCPM|nr:alanine--tRNA ligase [Mycoplasmoides pneumoniae]ADK87117.1 alanine--tRNA ligase [Mycoplasmoides pneumoniae FH]ALA30587.1 alanyl-tRNA synthetase [Mycoplasmoides pneumoniae 19294]ALA31692.1 alanyl-tRNA synthetase [Mycoplasmoides pneumoniae 39443]ALA35920.1 alanyl-tRNA synthetase [Mycoplasmoides pneumoniae FH]ALA36630.1 alanyl-tRNA synthetase [Mycoplasmoides pneumoniae M1139]
MKWTTDKVRQTWLDYFTAKGHLALPSKSLIPVNDPSLLWINSGVATLKDYFSAKKTPPSKRLANAQICLRVNDIENVGFTSRHQTLFEMLGNFSIGDYFKEEAIGFANDLLVNHYHLDPKRFYITVYQDDELTFNTWLKHGIPASRIIKCDRDRNFWDLGLGPCGPCTEIYYDRGERFDPHKVGEKLFFEDIENDRYVEVWNIVFSQFNNDGNGNYSELAQKNIDTGAGIERLVAILQDAPTNFDTDIFLKLIGIIEQHCKHKYDTNLYFKFDQKLNEAQSAFRIISDHFKAITFTIAEGVLPGPNERSYIVRRLLRRALLACKKLDLDLKFIDPMVDAIISVYGSYYQQLQGKNQVVQQAIWKEVTAFDKTINLGLMLFEKSIAHNALKPQVAFQLYETYGFPIEMIKELVDKRQLQVDWKAVEQLMEQHRLISKQNSNTLSFEKQNEHLVNFKTASEFLYEANEITAKVIGLFDEQYQPVQKLHNQSGYVVFDQTVLYATSGGQRYDEGYCINHSQNDQRVSFQGVFKGPNKQHFHFFLTGSFQLGDKVILVHDGKWRQLVKNNHSLEHLLHAALQKEIDPLIKQDGAFKSAQKATIDFNFSRALTWAELERVEHRIRQIIQQDIQREEIFTDLEGSQKLNAIAYFEEEYSNHELLRVIRFGDFSVELCGGTHVEHTGLIENCFITDYYARGTGRWRIEIISSNETIAAYLNEQNGKLSETINSLHNTLNNIANPALNKQKTALTKQLNHFHLPQVITDLRKCQALLNELKITVNELKTEDFKWKQKQLAEKIKQELLELAKQDKAYVLASFAAVDPKLLSQVAQAVLNQHKNKLFVLLNQFNNSPSFMLLGQDVSKCIQLLKAHFELKGGGSNNFFRGSFNESVDVSKLQAILDTLQ